MAVLPTLDNLRGLLQRVIFVPIVYGFISLLPIFLTGWENSDRLADRLFSTIRSKENTFDFIVVGGGTAGALVANRLAEHYRVLLLEAGGTPMPFQTIPALALKFLNHPQTDWSFKTVQQRNASMNSVNQQSSWSAGRGLGGTTNINFMTHVRGHPMDYENWREITGDPGWGYQGVLPYFKRCEHFSGTSNDPEARGHDGELRIRKPSYIGLSEDWIRAGQEIGYPFVDLNGRHEEGFGILQYPIYKGIRQSTYASFLLPMHKSPRLTIRRYALVRKVLFRDMLHMAYGVEYVRHGRIETAIATKEVILSAGTLGSAKLLLLSGIGPRQQLERFGIPVRSELPVGHNLQDHLAVHLGPFFIKEPKSFLFDRDVTPENIVRWLFLGTGPITTTGYQGAASVSSSIAKSRGEGNWPDLHLILHGQAIHQGYTDAFAYAYSLQEDEILQYYQNAIGRDSFHIYVVGARPTSKGQVRLTGASINDPLEVDPKYLQDGGNFDFKILLEGVKLALNIANTSMFQRLGTEFTTAKLPGCQEWEMGSEAYWECYVRRFTVTMHNPVGTAAMMGVVDPTLKVRGTRGLRVVDASVQPTVVTTGTSASTLMIAEKGADMILGDYGIPDRDQDLFDVIFGRNGFFKRNPILRILQREFDQINPLRALFKPFIAGVSAEGEGEAKERFTRNGRLDNPLLQVISEVFGGNSNYGQGGRERDLAEEETRINWEVEGKRRREAEEREGGNVISKSQWVLEPVPVKIGGGGLKEGVKKKGGKRWALLQKILREQELNATGKFPSTSTTPPTTPPSVKVTGKPVVEVVHFEKPVVNVKKLEEIKILDTPSTLPPSASSSPSSSVGVVNSVSNVVAKPVSVNGVESPLPVIPVSPIPFPYSSVVPSNPPSSPLAQLFKSLSSFESFMNSFTAKDRLPPLTFPPLPPLPSTTPPPPIESYFKAAPSQNIFSGSNGNIFNFLSAPSTGGNGGSTQGPFHFLWGITSPSTPSPAESPSSSPPTTTPISNDLANAVGAVNSAAATDEIPSNITSPSKTRNESPPSIFSSWFKPLPKSSGLAAAMSSWFKPFKPLQSTSSWFQPNSLQTPSTLNWFKPLNLSSNSLSSPEKSPSPSSPASSWFNPFKFNTLQKPVTSSSPPPFSSPAPPSTAIGDLFELFLGGLKKHERRAVFKTMNTLLEAGEGIAELLGAPDPSIPSSSSTKAKDPLHFFQQISKGKRDIDIPSKHLPPPNLLKSLIALNQVLASHKASKVASSTTPPKMDDDSLENFLTTFEYPPSAIKTAPPNSSEVTTTPLTPTTTPAHNQSQELT